MRRILNRLGRQLQWAIWPILLLACVEDTARPSFEDGSTRADRGAPEAGPPTDSGRDDRGRPDAASPELSVDADPPVDLGTDASLPDLGPDAEVGPAADAFVPLSAAPCEPRNGMTGVPFADGTCYLMDPRPVTQGAYLAALDIAPLASSHPACANQAPADGPRGEEMLNPGQPGAFEPCHRTMGRSPEMPGVDLRLPWPPVGDALDDPMVCINWCDAHAYCERMGKRLCGQRGDDVPAEYDGERAADSETAEYMNACSASGRFAFPTGSTPVAFESAPEHCGEYRSFWLGDPACPNWEGPFGGLNAMGRGMEFVGPWYQSISFGFTLYAHVDTEPTAGCNLLTSAEHQQMLDLKQNELAAGLGFRCCGDYGAGP